MFTRSPKLAERWFANEVLTKESEIAKNAACWDMWYLGIFDDDTGAFELDDSPRLLANGRQLQIRLLKEAGELN